MKKNKWRLGRSWHKPAHYLHLSFQFFLSLFPLSPILVSQCNNFHPWPVISSQGVRLQSLVRPLESAFD